MLMEMEKAGECIGTTSAWRLKGQARTCLAKHYTDGKIDELLKTEALSYADVQAMLKHGDGAHGASPLKLFYPYMKFADLLAAWMVDPGVRRVR